jgi:hypothetical protein
MPGARLVEGGIARLKPTRQLQAHQLHERRRRHSGHIDYVERVPDTRRRLRVAVAVKPKRALAQRAVYG